MACILVADDDEFTLELIALWLDQAGHTVVTASDGNEAADRIEQGDIGFLVTDLFMPNKEGTELIMEIRQSHPDIGILAISGHAEGSTHLKTARLLGAKHVLKKPLEQGAFMDAVAALLD